MSDGNEIVQSSATVEAMREVARQEARAALVALVDQDLATLRLGEELGIPPRELARRSARVTLTDGKDEDRALVMIVTESEDHLHAIVDTLRAPVSVRYKIVTHAPSTPQPELPAPRESSPSQESAEEESPSSPESQSSYTEGAAT